MPIEDRDYIRGRHPPSCTCQECTAKRLGKFRGQTSSQSRKTPQKPNTPTVRAVNRPHPSWKTWETIPPFIRKLFLSLIVITGLADIIRRGHLLFVQQTDPIKNTIIFLTEVGLWIWIVVVLRSRRYKYRQPKFKLTLITVIAITLVCAFAGIEPLSSYKDNVFTSISSFVEEHQLRIEAEQKAEEEARIRAEALAQAEAERKAREGIQTQVLAAAETEGQTQETAVAPVSVEEQGFTGLNQLIHQLINMERTDRGLSPLQISLPLTSLAEEHSREMVTYDYFSHDRMGSSRPFDWGMQPRSTRGENIFMMPERLVIPGPFLTQEELATIITQDWMESPGHRQNILESSFSYTGIGIAKKGIYYYVTQMFEGQY